MAEQEVVKPDVDETEGAGDDSPREKTVPLKAMLAEREKRQEAEKRATRFETKLASLEGKLDGFLSAKAGDTEPGRKTYSKAQLDQSVAQGQITQEQADALLEQQREREIDEKVSKRVGDATTKARIETEIASYLEAVPAIRDEDSDVHHRVQQEFDALVALGDSDKSPATTLKAMRAVLGPPDRMKNGKRLAPETYGDTGGGEGGNDGGGDKDGAMPKDLSPREKAHYTRLIDRGVYSGWAAVREELKHANQGLRARMRART